MVIACREGTLDWYYENYCCSGFFCRDIVGIDSEYGTETRNIEDLFYLWLHGKNFKYPSLYLHLLLKGQEYAQPGATDIVQPATIKIDGCIFFVV